MSPSLLFAVTCAAVLLISAVCISRGIIAVYLGGSAIVGVLPVLGDVLLANLSGMPEKFVLAFGGSAIGMVLFFLISPIVPVIGFALFVIGAIFAVAWLLLWFVYCIALAESLDHKLPLGLLCAIVPFAGFPMLAVQLPPTRQVRRYR